MAKTNKLLAVIGPTASGKSDLAIKLAKRFNGEIISVDSRQVYKFMDIGTGKVKGKKSNRDFIDINKDDKTRFYPYISDGIKHWLIDIIDPRCDSFSVADFQDLAYQIIFDIFSRGKTPILVGGTMLYMDAVLYGYLIPKTSLKLREELEKFSDQELLSQLKEFDPLSHQKIDHHNRRRIIRAVESYLLNQRSLSEYRKKQPNFRYLILGINFPRQELYRRIDLRVDERLKQGMVEEVKKLLEIGVPYQRLQDFGLEYRYISEYLDKSKNEKRKTKKVNEIEKTKNEELRQEMVQKLKYKIHAFARRQLTWWRRNKEIHWIKPQSAGWRKAEKLIKDFLPLDK